MNRRLELLEIWIVWQSNLFISASSFLSLLAYKRTFIAKYFSCFATTSLHRTSF